MTTESPRWFKSSYSADGGQCVEVAHNLVPTLGLVPLRDSKVPAGPSLSLSAAAFVDFIESVKQ
ncbi:DUF397 domain-containing protein [Streptomyces sp. R302]|uniref:DUF397 domain-containing protein n=1 Tax=unclassified Streptomyces TaxID=2593676 RepID=UPI00145D894B|nr:DUF397 domain-containing protein [Streptomyces sp. R301]NML81002.1 DUF397 domain-containing protein [Streptomyces sp. R302]